MQTSTSTLRKLTREDVARMLVHVGIMQRGDTAEEIMGHVYRLDGRTNKKERWAAGMAAVSGRRAAAGATA